MKVLNIQVKLSDDEVLELKSFNWSNGVCSIADNCVPESLIIKGILEHWDTEHVALTIMGEKVLKSINGAQQEYLDMPEAGLSFPDIRNKLSPIKNLIAMLKGQLKKMQPRTFTYSKN